MRPSIPDDKIDTVAPSAAAMIESMRAYGYTPATAIADIIDNSISAQARNVWLTFHWKGAGSYIVILDDGCGMTEEILKNAMRPGSRSPVEERDPRDMGRFGLGLKTASFSQCRRLTVGSCAKGNKMAVRRWDLDYVVSVDKWNLLKFAEVGSERRLACLNDMPHGTVVLWEQLDRITGDSVASDKVAHDRFLDLVNAVEKHLAMVFHRFLEGTKARLKIFINGDDESHRVVSWDPFLEKHPATIRTPNDPIPCGSSVINVQGFVLPHKDKLGDELHDSASGPSGWNAQQGFYVYRNERLLVPGSWLGLGKNRPWTKEEHYKLARIRVDIPNTADLAWQIDVKKSTARPPAPIRNRLTALAEGARKQAREVFAHRGNYGQRPSQQPLVRVWKPVTKDGRLFYRIDRTHPLVRQLLSESKTRQLAETVLRVLEETLPVQQIWLDTAEKPDIHSRPFEQAAEADVVKLMRLTYEALRKVDGMTAEAARQRLLSMDAFQDYRTLAAAISETSGEE